MDILLVSRTEVEQAKPRVGMIRSVLDFLRAGPLLTHAAFLWCAIWSLFRQVVLGSCCCLASERISLAKLEERRLNSELSLFLAFKQLD